MYINPALLSIPQNKIRFCWIHFYHSFFQNNNVIAVLIFEKKHGSYSVNPKKKLKTQSKTRYNDDFFFEYVAETNPIAILDENGFFTRSGPGSQGPQGPNRHIFWLQRRSFFCIFLWSKKLAHLILKRQAYGNCTA